MKTLPTAGLVAAAVAITFAIQETRIASLRRSLADVTGPAAARSPAPGKSGKAREASGTDAGTARPARAKTADRPAPPAADAEVDESLGKTVRKMWENPASKAMMNQGVKMAVGMMYGDFVQSLGLTGEEQEYFKTLLGKGIADQQELGMKMMSATAEERLALGAEFEERKRESEEAIKAFLNSDEDHARFTAYQDRLPERQQLDGVRAAFAALETPLDTATEERLVEAMYQARTTANTPDSTGPGAFARTADPLQHFEQRWALENEALMKEAGTILDPAQLESFREYRSQMKEMQLMGMKMAEKMMEGEEDDAAEGEAK
jgi:hypothetical protein